ncbi:MAG: hypothetical protein ACLFVE_11345 [Chitinispirillaceae bacterium]
MKPSNSKPAIFIEKLTTPAQLYSRSARAGAPDQCYILLDCKAKEMLATNYKPADGIVCSENGQEPTGAVLLFPIPVMVADAANTLMSKALPIAERVVLGYSRGKYSPDALQAITEIIRLCDIAGSFSMNVIQELSAAEFIKSRIERNSDFFTLQISGTGHKITSSTTDSEIEDMDFEICSCLESNQNLDYTGDILREYRNQLKAA